ncbi:MAG: monofunctional biosynthetic peptidoglycan transglycosylase [Henriciella sp.]
MDGRAQRTKRGLTGWLRLVFKLACLIFLALHVYALALKFVPAPPTVTMAQRVIEGYHVRRNWTPLEDFSPHMIRAVIAAEDSLFCAHKGIDIEAVQKAVEEAAQGRRQRGASTITQQTAKNVFLWNGGGMPRKAGEAWLASFIDYAWGKRRVMEVYLNVAEWGDGLFGAEAAALVWFAKPASELTAREAAYLAAVLPSPNKWRLDPPGPYVRQRAATLQARMRNVERDGLADCVLGSG